MKIQNAIDYFKNYIEFCKESLIGAPTLEPYEIAIECMEKQIPKSPIYEAERYFDGKLVYDMAYCPQCRNRFDYGLNDWNSAYCPECGQNLDWSD